MTLTDLFKYLGAPLKNPRWSWGSVRAADGAVVLRVWQDRKRKINDKWHMQITHRAKYLGITDNAGNNEREEHLQLIKAGAQTIMIMCEAKDVMAEPRDIKAHDERDVFPGGQLIEADGDYWIELTHPRVPVQQARLTAPETVAAR